MSPTNGHASDPANVSTDAVQQFATPASDTNSPTAPTPNAAKIKELIASLEIGHSGGLDPQIQHSYQREF